MAKTRDEEKKEKQHVLASTSSNASGKVAYESHWFFSTSSRVRMELD